jgi:hypothetical protein
MGRTRRAQHYFAKQYFRALGNLLPGLLWAKKSLDGQFTWTLHEDKFKHHVLRLIDGLLKNNRECKSSLL